MKVAFASTDKIHIDEHFARAANFVIWEIDPDDARLAGVAQVAATGDDEDDKIAARLAVLADCAIVYVTQIGGPAAARLVASKIHPLKSKGVETIADVIEKLQQVLCTNPPPWMRKRLPGGERPGFVER
ncbi:MAG: nitrogen fixation protein NifX [Desulfuromonadales bacterium]|nr:nitrogen fixation protein NifX [Desulfuromonadales bacterium]